MAGPGAASTPHFQNPPVVETVLGVQFTPLRKMRITHYGLLLPHLCDAFPAATERLTRFSEQPPLDPIIESFEQVVPREPSLRWSVTPGPPLPRCWYASDDEQYLLQVQPDRFLLNWRQQRGTSGEYPRYTTICDRFLKSLRVFRQFAAEQSLGSVEPNQCEVTYVNHIELLPTLGVAATLDRVLMGWKLGSSDGWLTQGESGEFKASYVIAQKRGRLHVDARPAVRRDNGQEIIRLDLTARGAPPQPDLDGVRAWLDLGHEWVVRGFKSLTTSEMHTIWGLLV